jgi:hypothetical protein
MDEHRAPKPQPVRRKRASKAQVRAFAWTASGLSFLGALVSFTMSPKPAQGATPGPQTATRTRPVVMVITKKIVYAPAAQPVATSNSPIHYVYTPPAAAAPAVAVSCGTHPC